MSAISVGELAEVVGGRFFTNPEQSGEMVENLMVGAMCADPAPLYFGTRSDKAVITRGDRADIQLGALATLTKCLVLTGGTNPTPSVISTAESKKVPIILVDKDTPTLLSGLEAAFSQASSQATSEESVGVEAPVEESPTETAE